VAYGLNTEKFPTRKWGKTITYNGELKGQLGKALDKWSEKTGVKFQTTEDADPDFVIKWGTSCQWSPPGGGAGRPESKPGTLSLKESVAVGTMMHEIGHLLGLSHEHDRPDSRGKWYDAMPANSPQRFGKLTAEANSKYYKTYGDYEPGSMMHYPESHYAAMTEPTEKDVAAVKVINGWT